MSKDDFFSIPPGPPSGTYSNRAGGNLTVESMLRAAEELAAQAGQPLGAPDVTIIARAVASWAQVRYLCVSTNVAQAILKLPESDAALIAASVEVLVVPEMPANTVMPVDREFRPVCPPGGWQEAFEALRDRK